MKLNEGKSERTFPVSVEMSAADAARVAKLSHDGSPATVLYAALDLFCRVVAARNDRKVIGSIDPETDALSTVSMKSLEKAAQAKRYIKVRIDEDDEVSDFH